MFKNLLEIEEYYEISPEVFGIDKCKFLRDFGPWKKDQIVENIWFNLEEGTATQYEVNENDVTAFCNFQIEAITK